VLTYSEFIAQKQRAIQPVGIDVLQVPLHHALKTHQKQGVKWALKLGRAALFWGTGMGKTAAFTEWASQVYLHTGKDVLILVPLGVRQQTINEAHKIGIETPIHIAEHDLQVKPGITVTNYDRLSQFDTERFTAVVLDEGSILKSLDGKTRNELIDRFRDTPYKLVATATPSPNDHMELGSYAEFLNIMTYQEMLSTFFVHDGGDTSKWRLKGHARTSFWRWVASWAMAARLPSDITGNEQDNEGYNLPPLHLHTHTVEAPVQDGALFAMEARSLTDQRKVRKVTLPQRCEKAAELVNASDEQWLVWCELNAESELLAKLIPGAIEVRGSDKASKKEWAIEQFTTGQARVLISKASMFGHGLNLQNSRNAVFVGVSHSFEMTHQALKRQHRYGQFLECHAHFVYSDAEAAILRNYERKSQDYDAMMGALVEAINQHSGVMMLPYEADTAMIVPDWLQTAA
jgi:superfamily II DNA or RNA helicase